jgi:hypothetical protein
MRKLTSVPTFPNLYALNRMSFETWQRRKTGKQVKACNKKLRWLTCVTVRSVLDVILFPRKDVIYKRISSRSLKVNCFLHTLVQ